MTYTEEGHITATETSVGFEVHDTGPGIPPDEVRRIFEAGVRGRAAENKSGSGLGLSIAERICKRLGWQIRVLTSDSGAHFEVRIAVSAAPRADRTV